MWYKLARISVALGGGAVRAPQPAAPVATPVSAPPVAPVTQEEPIPPVPVTPDDTPAIRGITEQRANPLKPNPEYTTLEEQLGHVRQEKLNSGMGARNMQEAEAGHGDVEIMRGGIQYKSGKGVPAFDNLPSNRSWA